MKRILAKTTALLSAISIGTFGFSPVITQAATQKVFYVVENPIVYEYSEPTFQNYDDAKEFCKAQGAGYVVNKYDGNWTTLYVHGDIDENGKIGQVDLTFLKRCLAGNIELTPEQVEKADIDNNGVINTRDFSLLKQYYINYTNYTFSMPK